MGKKWQNKSAWESARQILDIQISGSLGMVFTTL